MPQQALYPLIIVGAALLGVLAACAAPTAAPPQPAHQQVDQVADSRPRATAGKLVLLQPVTPQPPTPTPLPTLTPTPSATPTPPPTPTPTPVPWWPVVVPASEHIDIHLQSGDGQQRGPVASVARAYIHPLFADFVSLSPDMRQVLYVTSQINEPMNTTIWVAEADGSGATPIAHFSDTFWSAAPIWSPDSSQIAYVTKRTDAAPEEGLQLWRMQRDGSNATLVTEGGAFRPALFAPIPQGVVRWSSDSRRLEFRDRWSNPPTLYSVELASGTIHQTNVSKEPDLAEQLAPQRATDNLPCPVPTHNQKNYPPLMSPCGWSIHRAGCAVTAMAIVLGYYGVETDPAALNSCMGELACPLWWSEAPQCAEGRMWGLTFQEPFSYELLDQELAAGRPAIVLVTSQGTHFVVVTGGSGQHPGGYTISDPVDGSSNKTLARYADMGWNLEQINRFDGVPHCPDSAESESSDPDGGDIVYGQEASGTIDPPGDYDDFFFTAAERDHIEIQVGAAEGSALDVLVFLYGPDDMRIALDDDSGGGTNALLPGIVPQAGRYRARVQGYGESGGGYWLQIQARK